MRVTGVDLENILARSDVLPRSVYSEVVEAVVRDLIHEQKKGAKLEILRAEIPLKSNSGIGRSTADRRSAVVDVNADRAQEVAPRIPVDADLGVNFRVPPSVQARAEGTLRQCPGQHGVRGWRWREGRAGVGETPGRQRIPSVLHARRVVDVDSEQHWDAEQRLVARRAQIELIPSERAPDAVKGELAEPAIVSPKTASEKNADLIDGEVVVVAV